MSRQIASKDLPASTETTENRTRRLVITAELDKATGETTYQVFGEREIVTRIGGEIRSIDPNGGVVVISHNEVVAHKDFAAVLSILPAAIDDQEAAVEKRRQAELAAEAMVAEAAAVKA